MSREPDNLDEQLDRALLSYTPVAPRPGLEDRITARLAAAAPTSVASWQWLFWPAAIAATAILLAVLPRIHTPAIPRTQSEVARNSTQPNILPTPPLPHSRSLSINPEKTTRIDPHAASRIPTQEPLASLSSVAEEQEKPIEIKPLTIEPLVVEPIPINPIEVNRAEDNGAL
jgi:hypothetical protein